MRKFLCSCGYLGYLPLIPGTFGTLPGVALFIAVQRGAVALGCPHTPIPDLLLFMVLLAASAASVAWGQWAQTAWGAQDPRPFVLDEFAGYLVAALFLGGDSAGWKACIAFLFFRFFDVVKPFPARRLEALPGGWGILMDDIAAGIYANLATHMVLWCLPARWVLAAV